MKRKREPRSEKERFETIGGKHRKAKIEFRPGMRELQ